MPSEIRNVFYSATDDFITIAGRIFVDSESERYLAKTVYYITEGGQRDIIGNLILPLSGVKLRQRLVSRFVNDAIGNSVIYQ